MSTIRLDKHQIQARHAAIRGGLERLQACVAELMSIRAIIGGTHLDPDDGDPVVYLLAPPPSAALHGAYQGRAVGDAGEVIRFCARLKTCDVLWEVPV